MCRCQKHQCAGGCGITLLIFLVGALSTPWYYSATEIDGAYNSCSSLLLVGWQKAYCSSSGTGCVCPKSNFNWRDEATSDQKTLFDTAGALTGVAFALYFVMVVGLLVRCYGVNKQRQIWHTVLGLLGTVLLVAAISYFANKAPDAFDTDGFFGSKSIGNYTYSYGGFGWGIGVLAIIFGVSATIYSHQNDLVIAYVDPAVAYTVLPGQAYPPGVYAQQQQYAQPPQAYYGQPQQGYYNQQGAPGYQPPTAYVPIGRTDAAPAK